MNIVTIIICIIPLLLLQSTARSTLVLAFSTKQLHYFQLPPCLVCQNSLLRHTNFSRSYDDRGQQRRCYNNNHRAISFELQLSKNTEEKKKLRAGLKQIEETILFEIKAQIKADEKALSLNTQAKSATPTTISVSGTSGTTLIEIYPFT